jgi:hypothetical protein
MKTIFGDFHQVFKATFCHFFLPNRCNFSGEKFFLQFFGKDIFVITPLTPGTDDFSCASSGSSGYSAVTVKPASRRPGASDPATDATIF